jgi:hypothetical protein
MPYKVFITLKVGMGEYFTFALTFATQAEVQAYFNAASHAPEVRSFEVERNGETVAQFHKAG